ncbi:MAG TPA: hypothetical protein DDX99_01445 [Desulfofustis sp.]|jgi:hypothetical protein|nr:hypothetical protein [Desulfofustis sp.]HBH32832.1 hypothetical protein [Desulfofustis sp.]
MPAITCSSRLDLERKVSFFKAPFKHQKRHFGLLRYLATHWQQYIQLTEIEQAFKELNGDLALMAEYQQIVHQLEAAQAALKAELMACLGGKA